VAEGQPEEREEEQHVRHRDGDETAIWPTGEGIGSRKSYSLYSRFSIRQMPV
jgi:hypothetical protein